MPHAKPRVRAGPPIGAAVGAISAKALAVHIWAFCAPTSR